MSWKETDPLALWKASSTLPQVNRSQIKSEELDQHPDGDNRGIIWQSLSQKPIKSRERDLSNLYKSWPYWKERYAFWTPDCVLSFIGVCNVAYISTKINGHIFSLEPKISFWNSMRRVPTFLPVYSSIVICGVLLPFTFKLTLINRPLIVEENPISFSTIFSKLALIHIFSTIVAPIVSTPYLCIASSLRLSEAKELWAKDLAEFLTLSYKYSRSVHSRLHYIIALQLALIAICAQSIAWSRNRIYYTIGAHPELIRDLMTDANETSENSTGLGKRIQTRVTSVWSRCINGLAAIEWKPPDWKILSDRSRLYGIEAEMQQKLKEATKKS